MTTTKLRHTQLVMESQRRHPAKHLARQAVYKATRDGKLPRVMTLQCIDCGGQAQSYDHHEGYSLSHQLNVQPVCWTCHRRRGVERKEYRGGGTGKRGYWAPRAILTVRQVKYIYSHADASPSYLAKKFNTAISTIYNVRSGRTWEHLMPSIQLPEDAISLTEAYKFIGVTRHTIWYWRKRKKITAIIVGAKKFYRKADLIKAKG